MHEVCKRANIQKQKKTVMRGDDGEKPSARRILVGVTIFGQINPFLLRGS